MAPTPRDGELSAPGETRARVSVPGPVLLELLCVTVRLGVCNAVLADVVALARQASRLSAEQLRAALVALADRAARLLLEGEVW